MITKTYKLNGRKQRCSFAIPKTGRSIVFECINYGARFSDNTPRYSTADADEQAIIEGFDSFKCGDITIEKEIGNTTKTVKTAEKVVEEVEKKEDDIQVEPTIFEDVTTAQKAKEVLRSEPFNVSHQSMGTVEKVKAKADELGVSFPNVAWD